MKTKTMFPEQLINKLSQDKVATFINESNVFKSKYCLIYCSFFNMFIVRYCSLPFLSVVTSLCKLYTSVKHHENLLNEVIK